MPIGPGKYDALATLVRKQADASTAVVAVIGGNQGSGFSVQSDDPATLAVLPRLLRMMADEIERSAAPG